MGLSGGSSRLKIGCIRCKWSKLGASRRLKICSHGSEIGHGASIGIEKRSVLGRAKLIIKGCLWTPLRCTLVLVPARC